MKAWIEAEKNRPEPPDAEKELARARLAALLGPAAGLGKADPPPPPPPPPVAAVGPGMAKLVGSFLLGSVVTGALAFAFLRPEPRVQYVDRVVTVAASAEAPARPEAAPVTATPPPSTSPARPTSPPVASAPIAPAGDAELARERGLVERAQAALARGDANAALAAVAAHAREFPRGQLVEEREVIAVQALVAAGRVSEAAERGARFRKAHPESVLLPLVDKALR